MTKFPRWPVQSKRKNHALRTDTGGQTAAVIRDGCERQAISLRRPEFQATASEPIERRSLLHLAAGWPSFMASHSLALRSAGDKISLSGVSALSNFICLPNELPLQPDAKYFCHDTLMPHLGIDATLSSTGISKLS